MAKPTKQERDRFKGRASDFAAEIAAAGYGNPTAGEVDPSDPDTRVFVEIDHPMIPGERARVTVPFAFDPHPVTQVVETGEQFIARDGLRAHMEEMVIRLAAKADRSRLVQLILNQPK